jgi:hypothetical protein
MLRLSNKTESSDFRNAASTPGHRQIPIKFSRSNANAELS